MNIEDKLREQIKENNILIYMKGTPYEPQCGFSARTVQILIECDSQFSYVDVIENNDNIFSVIKSLIKNKIEFEIDINSKISKSALQSANIEEDNIKSFVELNDSYDFAISVGGDGTILNSVEKIGELSIPIIGLNTGRLGFLANSSLKNLSLIHI